MNTYIYIYIYVFYLQIFIDMLPISTHLYPSLPISTHLYQSNQTVKLPVRHHLGLLRLEDDGRHCPLATGSRRGLCWVRLSQPSATLDSLRRQLQREAHEVQTSLCEFDKYISWSLKLRPVRKRRLHESSIRAGMC